MVNIQRFLPLAVGYALLQTISSGGITPWMTTFATFFAAILLEAMPFMLIGAILSGTIEVFVPRERIARWVPQNRFVAVMLFGLLGIIFPICECGIVPVIRRLLRKGVPLSCGITYLLAAPIVQPVVLIATLVAFMGSWEIAWLRVLGGYLVAITVGMLAAIFLDPKSKEHIVFDLATDDYAEPTCGCGCDEHHHHDHDCGCDEHHHHDDDCCCGHDHADELADNKFAKVEFVLRHAAQDFLSTGSYLIFGAFIAAAMQTFIGQDTLARIGHGPILAPLVMMVLAFTLSLCSAADAFVATSFTQFSIAARMAFLVMGPMVDIKLMAMYNGFLSRKATIFIFGLAAGLAFIYSIVMRLVGM